MRSSASRLGPLSLFFILSGAGCASQNDRIAQLEQRVAHLEAAQAAPKAAPPTATATPSASLPIPAMTEEGWMMSGWARDKYTVREDPATERAGHATLLLAPIGDTGGKYGTWLRSIDAAPYRGKRVRLSAYTKTEGAIQRADFWARVQAADSPSDGSGLGAQWIRLPATSGWEHLEIVLDVNPAGTMLQYGVGVAGPGKLWVDAPKLEIVAADVPPTHLP
jgi:hypothetical protein